MFTFFPTTNYIFCLFRQYNYNIKLAIKFPAYYYEFNGNTYPYVHFNS